MNSEHNQAQPASRAPDSGGPAMAPTATTAQMQNVTRRFGRFPAVRGVDLPIGMGVFGLLGPNGAGKTTLLRIMATVISPTSGTVRLLGCDPAVPAERRQIRRRLGYLPQALGYYPNFTVTEFVEYFALLKEIPRVRVSSAVADAIEQVGLGGRAGSKLRSLSGGMLRRAGIAQAIVNDPLLLLLDEPTAGLDPQQRMEFRALLRGIGERATVVVSTHLVEDVAAACGQVAMMLDGRIAFNGTPAELAACGQADPSGPGGDSPLERGYAAVSARARS
jgi:ABC-2 type transport system ATP-binding protein